tara:strand:- start:49809 stop:51077 length:1269 start_codon:yes stop_codon:yes gene_type:complete
MNITSNQFTGWQLNLFILQKFLIYLLPIALITGSFFSDLFAVISSIIFVILSLSNKQYFYYKNKIFIIFILWSLYLIIRSLFAEDIILSLESSLFYWRFGFFALSIWYILDNDKNFSKKFTLFFVFCYLLICIDGYYQFLTGQNLLGYHWNYKRLTGLFGSEHILGSYLSRLFPIFFALIAYSFHKNKFLMLFSMCILIATDLLIYLSGERSSFFYLFLSTLLIVILINRWKKIRLITFIISIILIIFITYNYPKTKERMIDTTLEQTNILGDKINAFSPKHNQQYSSAIKMIKDKPIIGVGPKMFRKLCKHWKYSTPGACTTHPHNTYIQLLAETGIIGFMPVMILFLYINFVLIKQAWFLFIKRKIFLTDAQLCLFVALYITLWPFVPTGNFFHNWLNVIYFLPIGFLFHFYYNEKHELN